MNKKLSLLFASIAMLLAALACSIPVPLIATPSPSPNPTYTSTLAPTETPTPTPELALAIPTQAWLVVDSSNAISTQDPAFFTGDWETAKRNFQNILNSSNQYEERAAALLGQGKAYMQTGKNSEALRSLRQVIDEHSESPLVPWAYFHLGEVYHSLQRYQEAADAYAQYLRLRPGILDGYVQELRGDSLMAAGDALAALDAYLLAREAPGGGGETSLMLKSAIALANNGDTETALSLLTEVYDTTSNDYVKAEMNWRRGQIYLMKGEDGYAHIHFYDSVEKFALSYYTYLGLVELIQSGVPVDEYRRGLIDYFAGQHGVAVAAFDRYLQTTTDHLSAAHYYKGMSLRELSAPEAAITEWNALFNHHTVDEPFFVDAWEQKGYTQWAFLGDYEAAIKTFLDFAAFFPGHGRAPDFVFYAAQVSERNGQLDQAATLWAEIPNNYPNYSQAFRSAFLAGITRYRLGEYEIALIYFDQAYKITQTAQDQSAASLWIGKSQAALNQSTKAIETWTKAAELNPTGYYSERARELARGGTPFSAPEFYDLNINMAAERQLAENWMRVQFFIQDDVDLSGPGPLAFDDRFIRGNELWNLGKFEASRLEFENLRLAYTTDPVANFRLANHFMEIGLYRTAIFCARAVLNIAGMDDAGTLTAPPYFNYIRFGTYYRDLVESAAEQYWLEPLLLFSLIRQESLFEGFVSSSAGARGLMQVMPATGQGINNKLGWPPDYTDADLYRPFVSIRFGSSYLADQIHYMSGSIYGALAAYNGGPGNARIWAGLSGDDPDLFLEVVRFEETRRYIRGIYEMFNIYSILYDRTP